jgi:hypothetical protein
LAGASWYNWRFNGEAGERGIANSDNYGEIIPASENYTQFVSLLKAKLCKLTISKQCGHHILLLRLQQHRVGHELANLLVGRGCAFFSPCFAV